MLVPGKHDCAELQHSLYKDTLIVRSEWTSLSTGAVRNGVSTPYAPNGIVVTRRVFSHHLAGYKQEACAKNPWPVHHFAPTKDTLWRLGGSPEGGGQWVAPGDPPAHANGEHGDSLGRRTVDQIDHPHSQIEFSFCILRLTSFHMNRILDTNRSSPPAN